MIKRMKAMSLALAALAIAGLSACTLGMITGAGYPVTVYTGVGVYGRNYNRLGYGPRRVIDPYYRNSYRAYGAFYGSPILLDGWSSSGSCDSRDCPSEVIQPATTQEALLPEQMLNELRLDPGLSAGLQTAQGK